MFSHIVAALAVSAAVASPAHTVDTLPKSAVQRLADAYVDLQLDADPTLADVAGLPPVHADRLPDRSPAALAATRAAEDKLAARLAVVDQARISTVDQPSYAVLHEVLAADRGARICRSELWNVNHVVGWPAAFAQLAGAQDVSTPEARTAALARWRDLPRFVDVEIANLRSGLAQGYSVPKPVARRVIAQLDGVIAIPAEQSPFAAPAAGADGIYRAQVLAMVRETVVPALARYRDFLRDEYLPRARDSLGLSALPDGRACYQALLRRYTTLTRTPEQVFALGQTTVARNRAEVVAIGKSLFGTSDFAVIVARVKDAPDNHFASREEALAFSQAALARTLETSGRYFEKLPGQPVVLQPMPDYLAQAGAPPHYEPESDQAKPAHYVIPLAAWKTQTRGEAEIAVFHETIPGHHLQVATARASHSASRLGKVVENAAYVEGWARYMEGFAEEIGLYSTPYARITRRVWPARGMVIDPGIHAMGWSRPQALHYLGETGRFSDADAEALVDRIAALPAQLTAYDSGGLEFVALRSAAERARGHAFNIRQFHQRLLDEGVVPLAELARHLNQ